MASVGGQGGRLGGYEVGVLDGIVAGVEVTLPTTANLMVPEDVSCEATLRALEGAAVESGTGRSCCGVGPKPVLQAALKLPVMKVEPQGGGGYHVQPVPGVGWAGGPR